MSLSLGALERADSADLIATLRKFFGEVDAVTANLGFLENADCPEPGRKQLNQMQLAIGLHSRILREAGAGVFDILNEIEDRLLDAETDDASGVA